MNIFLTTFQQPLEELQLKTLLLWLHHLAMVVGTWCNKPCTVHPYCFGLSLPLMCVLHAFSLISFKMVCSLWAPFLPRQGSLGALVHYQPASSRKRKAPTEPVISTLFYWSGPLCWFRSGSTSGSYNCCPSLWLVTLSGTLPFTCFLSDPLYSD